MAREGAGEGREGQNQEDKCAPSNGGDREQNRKEQVSARWAAWKLGQ